MSVTTYLQDKRLTVALSGEIDHHSARQILQTLAAKVELYLPTICILDYKDVTFMDSSGIAIVIFMLRRMRELGGELRLENVAAQPRKVLQAAGVNKLIQLQEVSRV